MKVAHLQQHLADLAKMLDASGAGKAVVADLHAISERLTLFSDLSLAAFAQFLGAAEEAVRKGHALSLPGKKSSAPRATQTQTKKTTADFESAAREVIALYEHAASPDTTDERIEAALAKLDGLSKQDLAIIAERMGIPPKKSDSKPSLVKSIRFWITDRRGKSLRAVL